MPICVLIRHFAVDIGLPEGIVTCSYNDPAHLVIERAVGSIFCSRLVYSVRDCIIVVGLAKSEPLPMKWLDIVRSVG